MIALLKKDEAKTSASAKVVDGKLILSFPEAVSPILWQMDLTQTKASALEILGNEEKTLHTLSLKTPKGENVKIAEFNTKEDAMAAFMATSNALENAHGQIRSAQDYANAPQGNIIKLENTKSGAKKWLTALGIIVVIFFLFSIQGMLLPRAPSSIATGPAQNTAYAPIQNPQSTSGVAVSADDFLNSQ